VSEKASARALLIVCCLLAALSVAPNNGANRPLNAHEILVAQTATEMQERGDYLIPYYNGTIRLEKPPLPYWLSILVHRFIGDAPQPSARGDSSALRVREIEARIPSLAAGILLLVATFQLGAAGFGDARVGLAAAAMLATTYFFFLFSRSARPEMLYASFCALQMLGIAGAIRRFERDEAPGRAALGALARSAIEVVTLPRRDRLRACQAPGCVLFFQETARHRAWCSSGCGNRARVARHYARSHGDVDP
jgi:4-amino-4-deoxy-L-arabinose transferase-like glycosyltransferase